MLYCAQGYSSADTDNWGNYEFLTVDSVSTTDITFTTSKSKFYGSAANGDANIGTSVCFRERHYHEILHMDYLLQIQVQ